MIFESGYHQLATFYLGDAVTKLGLVRAVVLYSVVIGVGMFMVLTCKIVDISWMLDYLVICNCV
jgi:hypothetical protein